MKRRNCARGVTLIELLAVIIALIVIAVVMLLLLPNCQGSHGARGMKDMTQIRGIQQALAIWANDHEGLYALPSKVDTDNATVASAGTAKDTTANIMSLLIYTGGISTELTISFAEANTASIVQDDDYMFDAPKTAVDPAKALWDPAFAADFTGGKIGNVSYAHIMPGGSRSSRWRDTFSFTEPVVGNRGPEITSITRERGRVIPAFAAKSSNTFLIHGDRHSWQGNVAYNDGHVNYEARLDPDGVTYKDVNKVRWTDCLFYDEPDDADGTNAFLSIWTAAGDAGKDFKGIWD